MPGLVDSLPTLDDSRVDKSLQGRISALKADIQVYKTRLDDLNAALSKLRAKLSQANGGNQKSLLKASIRIAQNEAESIYKEMRSKRHEINALENKAARNSGRTGVSSALANQF
ncbi:MAG: hypothetical protein PHO48_02830 [Candidatus Gracilibacteria bacterium]|jgi:predicted RNase H-like nuclease (RuvC/YqgF family)|nr:hypothetical protein [Candidatus Gracilibacteria bacterium]MDD5179116.1 hypothetical protein [Candidatus Gracilibacteria bacterium]